MTATSKYCYTHQYLDDTDSSSNYSSSGTYGSSGSYSYSSGATYGERNALDRARSYLRTTSFSYEGLIDQLEFEGFSHEEAVYGADHCGADWYEQAGLKAESYMSWASLSRSELIDQLEFEGFTHDQAVYGASVAGY